MPKRQIRVLVVDDSITARKMILGLCRKLGFADITEVDRADAALIKLIIESNFGLILCDWNMPGASGIDLLSSIKSNALIKHIPFVFVTAESEPRHIEAARKMGADEFLTKPIDTQKFANIIEKIVVPVAANARAA